MKTGMSGSDVLHLQRFLNSDVTTAISGTGDGSPGKETGYFGSLTKAAVARFQEKHAADVLIPSGLLKGNGFAGSATRAKLNALCGAVLGATTAAPAPALIVSSATQPPFTLAPANALYVPFTTIAFTAGDADVTVNKMVIERVGPGRDNAFYDIGLLDPEGSEFTWGYLNALHQVTLKDSFTIPAHTTQNYTVVGDMNSDLSGNDGEMPVLQVNSVEATAPVSGSFPIGGTSQRVNGSLTIGTASATLSMDDPRGDRTRYVNDTGITFSGIRISAGSEENLRLTYAYWEQSGSAAPGDIANVQILVGGTAYPATSDDGRSYGATLPGDGYLLKKGESVDVAIRGDLTGSGSGRTVRFDLHYGSDVGLTGSLFGFGVGMVPGGDTADSGTDAFLTDTGDTDGTSLTPFFAGSVVTISGGEMGGASKH